MKDTFKAYRIRQQGDSVVAGLEELSIDDLTEGDVVIEAHYSGINYKDALAATGRGKILRKPILNGGVDVSGVVVSSNSDDFQVGDQVLVSGAGLSEVYDGGYAEYVRVPAECVVAVPSGLTLKDVMVMGTPALTAALALHRMQENGQRPEAGPILVTGASGGVGNLVVDIFAQQGYEVIAVTSKPAARARLLSLGAKAVIAPAELEESKRPLEKARWAGAVDMVGGDVLAYLTRTVAEWGNIASIGLASSHELNTTVMPFILRGVSILGISSTNCPTTLRRALWQRLGNEWRPNALSLVLDQVVTMEHLPVFFTKLINNQQVGRVLVDVRKSANN